MVQFFALDHKSAMSPHDEKELHRLADMLRDIDTILQRDSPLREGLKKAGLALITLLPSIHGWFS